ncbi:Zn-ribbon domain-containing OB-fold protein [Ornithinicoccus halotolerans]|uniref:Zn-ribbon domain-containing OB-fold protein n=1 Tax=Ornithinicoccus halotolerans TaxID=1748220 RepID=UPI0012965F42|nr:Zn-ribbon domain-containing OB-fold protein [Ornithinicoccus halotolerans]
MSASTAPRRPGPTPTPVSQPFWDAAAAGTLTLQHCGRCDAVVFYPRHRCPRCWAEALAWRPASGRGTVATYTVVHKPGHPAFAPDTPYVVALIDLAEGPRMLSAVVGCEPGQVRIGMPVRVRFTAGADHPLPLFEPEEEP